MPLLRIPDGIRHIPLVVAGLAIALFSLIHIAKLIAHWGEIPHRRDEPPLAGTEIE